MLGRTLAALAAAAALFTSSADAAVIQERGPLLSATNGIALAPDGNLWVTEEFNDSVVRMTPGGTVLNRYTGVGDAPTSVAVAGTRVWVTVKDSSKLIWFDLTTSTPTVHDGPTGLNCGPVAIVDGGDNYVYYSMPSCSRLGRTRADGSGDTTSQVRGEFYDLAVTGGKIFAPDFGNDAVLRIALGVNMTPEASLGASGNPDGITADGSGNLWITLWGTGHVGRFAATQNLGTVTDLTPPGNGLTNPFGIVAGNDGRIYVTGKGSKNVARVDAAGNWQFYATGGEPWQIVNGTDGDLFFTDQSSTRILRFLSGAPRASTGAATAVATTVASATASVDTRGNETQVVFDYGPTAAYGATSAPVTLPAADGGAPVTVVLSGLAAGTTYHVRVRAANEEGEAAPGGDLTFATPAAPVPTPTLKARANFSWGFIGSRTVLTRIRVTDLSGGETIKVTCSGKGKGCPLKSKTYKNVKKGTRTLTSLFGKKKKLKTGAKIVVTITKPGAIGSTATVTIGKRKKDPKIVRKTLKPA
jgi:streptogramin lyase